MTVSFPSIILNLFFYFLSVSISSLSHLSPVRCRPGPPRQGLWFSLTLNPQRGLWSEISQGLAPCPFPGRSGRVASIKYNITIFPLYGVSGGNGVKHLVHPYWPHDRKSLPNIRVSLNICTLTFKGIGIVSWAGISPFSESSKCNIGPLNTGSNKISLYSGRVLGEHQPPLHLAHCDIGIYDKKCVFGV